MRLFRGHLEENSTCSILSTTASFSSSGQQLDVLQRPAQAVVGQDLEVDEPGRVDGERERLVGDVDAVQLPRVDQGAASGQVPLAGEVGLHVHAERLGPPG